jgi:methionyl aminopeptidase
MIVLKDGAEIEKIRIASRHALNIVLYLGERIREGMKTMELEHLCEKRVKEVGGIKAAFKGYNGYPYCLCISTNSEIVHGMPGDRVLRQEDVVGIDFGVVHDGYYGDVAVTFAVGKVSNQAERLMAVTEQALYQGIEQAREGNRVHDISCAIQTLVEEAGFSVVRDFVGHGIGRSLHEEPQVPNFGEKGKGVRLRKGMVLAIEPMVNMGASDVVIADNGWTARTRDGSLSAHFEHTVAITENGPDILSRI